jgi:hypothetical protein
MKILNSLLFLASPLLSFSQIVREAVTISDWNVSAYSLTNVDASMKVAPGLDVTFTYTQGAHSVIEIGTIDDFENCNTTNALVLANTTTTKYVLSKPRAKPFLLASGVSGECEAGHKIMIKMVKELITKKKISKKMELCTGGSTELETFILEGRIAGTKSPAKGPKKCVKECMKNKACMGGEWLVSVTGKGSYKALTRSCNLYSDIPTASGFKPEMKRDKAVCFYSK